MNLKKQTDGHVSMTSVDDGHIMLVNRKNLPMSFYPPMLSLVVWKSFNITITLVGEKLFNHYHRYVGYFSFKSKRETENRSIYLKKNKEQNSQQIWKCESSKIFQSWQSEKNVFKDNSSKDLFFFL